MGTRRKPIERKTDMEILKRIGACILGAFEGYLIASLIGGETVTGTALAVGTIIGGAMGFCWPMSTVIVIAGIIALSYRGGKRDD